MSDLLTVAEVAARWRVSKMTVYRLIHAGTLRCIKIGHNFRVPLDVVATFEKEEDEQMSDDRRFGARCSYCAASATRMTTSCYVRNEPPREYVDTPPLPEGVVSVAAMPVCDEHFEVGSSALCDAYGMASNFALPVPILLMSETQTASLTDSPTGSPTSRHGPSSRPS